MRLISLICENDSDLLPHFIKWYRKLGVTSFYFILHGEWSAESLAKINQIPEVDCSQRTQEPFCTALKSEQITQAARRFVGEWVVFADADEFLELPTQSLSEMIEILESAGINQLYATLLQRVTRDGSLPQVRSDSDLDELFPNFSYGLCEEMGLNVPAWKSKYPLARIDSDFTYSRGHHLPQKSVAHLPIRAVVHHFKWRDKLRTAFSQHRGAGTNFREMDSYRSYLSHHETLPIESAKMLSRDILFAEGWLRIPTSQEWPVITEMLQEKKIVSTNPIRIGFVTFELAGPNSTNGGIATAVSSLAKLLAAHSYQVEIFYCPFNRTENLPPLWFEIWAAHGIKLHFIPRTTDVPFRRFLPRREFNAFLLKRIQDEGFFDILHFHDTQGYAAPFALIKKTQLQFTDTKIAITTHGGTRWHNQNNGSPWNQFDYSNEIIGQRLCDILVSPSQYMIDYNKALDAAGSRQIHLFNILDPEIKSFKEKCSKPILPKTLAFFGRLERRKGIEFFIATLKELAANARINPEIFFCGRFGNGYSDDNLKLALEGLNFKFHFRQSLNPEQAMGLIKEKESLVILPSKIENSPYAVWEVIENQIPFLTNFTGGTSELIQPEDQSRATLPNTPSDAAKAIEHIFAEGMIPVRPKILALENELKHLKFWRSLKEENLPKSLPRRPLPSFRASDFRHVSPPANEEIVALIPKRSKIEETHLQNLADILRSYPQAEVVYPAFEFTVKREKLTIDTSILEILKPNDVFGMLNNLPLVVRSGFLRKIQNLCKPNRLPIQTGDILRISNQDQTTCTHLPQPIYKEEIRLHSNQINLLMELKEIATKDKLNSLTILDEKVAMPCAILSLDPLVTLSSILPNSPLGALPLLDPKHLVRSSLHLFHCDSQPDFHEELAWRISEAQKLWPNAKFCVLAKSVLQFEQLTKLGLKAICADLSIFVDERIFKPNGIVTTNASFDAVYRMPLSSFSNYHLASKIKNLALIAQPNSDDSKTTSEIRSQLSNAHFFNQSPNSDSLFHPTDLKTAAWFNQCDTGLALRSTFDNRLAVVQQLLCGTPIVSSATFHGCQDLLRPEYSIKVDGTPEAIAWGVQELQSRMLSREDIHEAVKSLLFEARRDFLNKVNTEIKECFGLSNHLSDLSHLVGEVTRYRNARQVFSMKHLTKKRIFFTLIHSKTLRRLLQKAF